MLLSIIIPVYNMEKYLKQCLISIDNQAFSADCVEIIIIDDGSTDKSLEICNEYANKYSYYKIYHKENGGVSSARNFGLRKALGKYIYWIDPDDYISDEWYSSIKELLCLDYDMIFFDYIVFDSKKNIYISYDKHSGEVAVDKYIYEFCIGEKIQSHLCTKIIKRSLWNNIFFDEKISYCEDYNALTHVSINLNKIFYCSKPLYYYRQVESSITRLCPIENRINMIKYSSERYNYFTNSGFNVTPIGVLISKIDFLNIYCYNANSEEKKLYVNWYEKIKQELIENEKVVYDERLISKKKVKLWFALHGLDKILKMILYIKNIKV